MSGNKWNFFLVLKAESSTKSFFVIKMTTENEHTASSQISEDETQKKCIKVRPRCRRGVSQVTVYRPTNLTDTPETAAIQQNLC